MAGAKSRNSWAHGSLQAERSCFEDLQGEGLFLGIFRGLNTDLQVISAEMNLCSHNSQFKHSLQLKERKEIGRHLMPFKSR